MDCAECTLHRQQAITVLRGWHLAKIGLRELLMFVTFQSRRKTRLHKLVAIEYCPTSKEPLTDWSSWRCYAQSRRDPSAAQLGIIQMPSLSCQISSLDLHLFIKWLDNRTSLQCLLPVITCCAPGVHVTSVSLPGTTFTRCFCPYRLLSTEDGWGASTSFSAPLRSATSAANRNRSVSRPGEVPI